MENIVFLPSWVNILLVVSLGVLFIISVAPKLLKQVKDSKQFSLPSFDVSAVTFSLYCVVAIAVIGSMAVYFFATRSLEHQTISTVASALILIIALCLSGSIWDAGRRDMMQDLFGVWAIAIILIIFVAIGVTNIAFAIIWLALTVLLAFIGWRLKT